MANPVCEVLLTEDELALPNERADSTVGAVLDFSGVISEYEKGRKIIGIEYEAHRAMAQHQLTIIGTEAAQKFELQRVIIQHRLGFVPVGEPSLLLRVAAKHRAEAFQAGQWIVDELKKKAPIWKHFRFETKHDRVENELQVDENLVSHK